MTAQTLFYILIVVIIIDFLIDKILDALNAKHFNDPIPEALSDVYETSEYKRSQDYKKERYKYSTVTSTISFIAILLVLFFEGFAYLDKLVRTYSENEIVITLLFFGIFMLINEIIMLPFSWYSTFVIEEEYGFNKTSLKTFVFDKLKSLVLTAIFGGAILALIVWFYQLTAQNFWLYAWGLVIFITLFANMFYAKLIVPIFNKQVPLQDGSLRTKIEAYAKTVGFELHNIFIIDGSKRSTKANAYF